MEEVFKALADPTRRELLDRLFRRDGQSLTELETGLNMTRFGVMKHLRLLEQAGLVVTRKVGRQRLHYLNPVPIRQIHDRWINKYTEFWAGALVELKAGLEKEMEATKPRQVYQLFIKTLPERLWQAITSGEFTKQYFYGTSVASSLRPGESFEYWRDGALMVEGRVLEAEPPRRLVHTWRSLYDPELAADRPSRVTWEIAEEAPGVCRLTVTHDDFDSETATYRNVAGGWMWVLSGLKSVLETGEPLAPPN